MDNIHIRRASLADADTIVAFNLALAAQTEQRTLDRGTLLAGVRHVLTDAALGVYWLAEVSGRCVGQLLLTREWSDWRNGLFWWIQSVYVIPELRGRGVYRALHRHVEQQARQTTGVCGLRLYTDRHNTSAQQVYERLGMQRTAYLLYETDWSSADTAAHPAARA
jgi:GNAT superfamily N-acetyltransferase